MKHHPQPSALEPDDQEAIDLWGHVIHGFQTTNRRHHIDVLGIDTARGPAPTCCGSTRRTTLAAGTWAFPDRR